METLISQEKVELFIKTLDLTNPNIKSTLSAIQFLHPQYLEQIMFYLSEEIIIISDLYSMDINNISMKTYLKALEVSTDSYVSYKEIYKVKLNSMPQYVNFLKSKKLNSLNLLRRQLLNTSSSVYTTYFLIDEYGIKDNSFKNVGLVTNIYDTLFFKSEVQAIISDILLLSNTFELQFGFQGLNVFCESLVNKIGDYAFIDDKNGGIIDVNLGTQTLLGFILREQYYDLPYTDISTNMNFMLNEMARDYELDTTKNGFFTLEKLLAKSSYKYETLFQSNIINREKNFITDLCKIIFIRFVFGATIYNSDYFSDTFITNETEKYNAIISIFEKFHLLSMTMIRLLKSELPAI